MKTVEVTRLTGLNGMSISVLVQAKVLVRDGSGIQEASLRNLQEGEHFVVCRKCGNSFIQLSTPHFKACGLTEALYLELYPGARIMSALATSRRAKTFEQRQAQSKKLKARFQTPEGEITKQQISAAAIRMQASEYVEMDGCYWHGCDQCGFPGVGKIHTYDKRKTTYLTNRGWTILRLPEHEIKVDIMACVQKVVAIITRLEGTHDQSKL